MKYKLKLWAVCLLGFSLIYTFTGIPVSPHARNESGELTKQEKKAIEEAREATATFRAIMQTPGKSIPKSLIKKAEAIAVFTNVKKGGFIVGGTGGDGIVAR